MHSSCVLQSKLIARTLDFAVVIGVVSVTMAFILIKTVVELTVSSSARAENASLVIMEIKLIRIFGRLFHRRSHRFCGTF